MFPVGGLAADGFFLEIKKMSAKSVQMVSLSVRRDMATTVVVDVPVYETALLKSIFGKENVQPANGAINGVCEINAPAEYERLCAKYGVEAVEKTFGEESVGRLQELIEQSQASDDEHAAQDAPAKRARAVKDSAPAV